MKMVLPLNNRSKPFAAFAPLKFVIAYLAFTLSIAVWGPIEYYMFPLGKTVTYMCAIIVAITIGYTWGIEVGVRPCRGASEDSSFTRRLLDFSLIIAWLALIVAVISASTSGQLNTDISNIGDVYLSGYEDYQRNTGQYSLIFILYSISLPFNFIAIVLGFYYFKSMPPLRRKLVAALAVGTLLFYVLGSGKQKQLGDILIYLFAVIALKYGASRKAIKVKWVAIIGVISITSLFIFAAILGQRYSSIGVDADNINRVVNSRIFFKFDHPVFSIFGLDYGLSIAMFLSYLSQGYYGLGLALEADWQWTYFLGSSYSISVLANRILGIEWVWPNNLVSQVSITTGWDESKWHTVFAHFASDFTFPGTVVLFGWFAYIYARTWISAISYENPFSVLMFSLMTVGMFFMPANNQLFHSPGGLFTVVVVSILYLWKGKRYDRPAALWRRSHRRGKLVPQVL
ncbi:hypothetical protein [Pelagerythrobacter aerophilus]|uniref:Oligosaccharide repeat unit polymerase n=1 Tax=Pelagerythrobacter aerophilus TaxID=2306995 RepID=A0A418NDZ4_9SPHN|nr:hypothetical protein [Pelagerythrobacter aerophilus]RIV76042.1 hypothetical protein D2V04_17545 [Pelagerythrobacter aerophilus]RIV80703.1 hypothetical protein D2V04_01580 [Pelagerythrobacter aerophilus]